MEDMKELTAEEQADILRHELEAVYGSSSYRIGRAVTWLPRNAKRGLKYLLHNGPIISAKYIYTYAKYHKIANKNYAYWACLQEKDYPAALKVLQNRITAKSRRQADFIRKSIMTMRRLKILVNYSLMIKE